MRISKSQGIGYINKKMAHRGIEIYAWNPFFKRIPSRTSILGLNISYLRSYLKIHDVFLRHNNFLPIPKQFFTLMLNNLYNDGQLAAILKENYGDLLRGYFDIYKIEAFSKLEKNSIEFDEDDHLIMKIFNKYGDMDELAKSSPLERRVGGFNLVYNPMRSLKPRRMSQIGIDAKLYYEPTSINPGQEQDSQFNFDMVGCLSDFHTRISFSEKNGGCMSLGLNKYPYAKGQGIMVPEPWMPQRPQFLTEDILRYKRILLDCFPEMTLSWNSIGSTASVNHNHFQYAFENYPLAEMVRKQEVRIRESNNFAAIDSWPLSNALFTDGNREARDRKMLDFIYRYVHDEDGNFVDKDRPTYYNILFADDLTILFLRQDQKIIPQRAGIGVGFSEGAGRIIVSDEAAFKSLTQMDIKDILADARAGKIF